MDRILNGNKTDSPKLRPLSTGALPEDFVLHRAGEGKKDIISTGIKPDTFTEPDFDIADFKEKDLEFDIEVSPEDDFDIKDIAFE